MAITPANLLWQGKRNRLGMPLSFTKYQLTTERLLISRGFFRQHTDEIMLFRIVDICLERTLLDRMLGVGTITLFSRDETDPRLKLQKIKQAQQVRELLSANVEVQRRELGINMREYYMNDSLAESPFVGHS